MRERSLNLPSKTDNVSEQYRPQVKVTVPPQDRRSPRGFSTNRPGVVPFPIHSSQPHAPVNPISSLGAKSRI